MGHLISIPPVGHSQARWSLGHPRGTTPGRNSAIGRFAGIPKCAGLTLMEFLIAATILGILTSMAVPAFIGFSEEFQVNGKERNFISGLKYAQSEAVKRNAIVSMCVAHQTTANTCDTTAANDWDQGWFIYYDADSNGAINLGGADPDVILRQQSPLTDIRVVTAADTNQISFNGSGAIAPSGTIYTLCLKDSANPTCADTDFYRSRFTSLASGQLVQVPL